MKVFLVFLLLGLLTTLSLQQHKEEDESPHTRAERMLRPDKMAGSVAGGVVELGRQLLGGGAGGRKSHFVNFKILFQRNLLNQR